MTQSEALDILRGVFKALEKHLDEPLYKPKNTKNKDDK